MHSAADVRSFGLAVIRAFIRHRSNAHAAEIAFFALLALVPATITLGGVLDLLSHVGGSELAARGQRGAAEAIRFLIGPKLADSVINPFVRTQLSQSRGVAVAGLLATAWLVGRAFYALTHALDVAFEARDRRLSRVERLIALSYAIAAVAVIAVTLSLMVLGWHSGKAGLDRFMGRTPIVAQLWAVLRWPLLIIILLGVVIGIYRYVPAARQRCRDCRPGAYVAVVLWIAAAVAFRGYLTLGAAAPTGVTTHDERVTLIGQAIGASIATGVWLYASALAILLGAEVNGQLMRERGRVHLGPARPDKLTSPNGRTRVVTAVARRTVSWAPARRTGTGAEPSGSPGPPPT